MWDAIVIGSGIGGLAAASALARCGSRVLVLEQHSVAGGLTQTFEREGWEFSTGVHYIGGVGPDRGAAGQFGRLLGWLSGGTLAFADIGNPYELIRIGEFEFGIRHPESAYQANLRACFPRERDAIDAWFDDCARARAAAGAMFSLRALPPLLAWTLRQWRGETIEHWATMTVGERLSRIADPVLRAVLGARWGDYGVPPSAAPFIEHALVTGSYSGGAYYPVGGPARFAQALAPVIVAAGGELRCGADVQRIDVAAGRVVGVRYRDAGAVLREERARHVISAAGVFNTMRALPGDAAPDWQDQLHALRAGHAYVALFVGFEGDIAAAGASAANVWIYEDEQVGRLWRSPAAEDAPSLFVSFPSLKDPSTPHRPTAEVIALCDADAFAPWLASCPDASRSAEYVEFKGWVEQRLLAQFERHFPALAPLVRYHELATPLTQRRYVRAPDGAMYGIEMSAERLTTPALRVRTPVPGLLLAGQDVSSPGVPGALMGGLMAAASIEPKLLRKLVD